VSSSLLLLLFLLLPQSYTTITEIQVLCTGTTRRTLYAMRRYVRIVEVELLETTQGMCLGKDLFQAGYDLLKGGSFEWICVPTFFDQGSEFHTG